MTATVLKMYWGHAYASKWANNNIFKRASAGTQIMVLKYNIVSHGVIIIIIIIIIIIDYGWIMKINMFV